ncbi:DUF2515 domain-containing protein [Bacillus sp. 165]|uniref:DUF2515 domain-containing protein n=1 Tax=Bacillus sp. 165 TaxID=1529117 RepID=UPI001FFE0EA3|nr:DUF2515 domain-containing protein [Bacillus sp. 165]
MEWRVIEKIKKETAAANKDNISRTKVYHEFFMTNTEIQWAFLASMVSRNAGWNMTDLEGAYYPKILSATMRKRLFLTYERANWFIFSDAYPQLVLYEQSKKVNRPLFHLLSAFHVSVFMEAEWERFWKERDKERLVTALIINEQNMIQKPVIQNPYFQKYVFQSLVYKFQELFHFSSVIFPTVQGKLYGFSVYGFEQLTKRIELGKRLAWLLLHPDYYETFRRFSENTIHTGSRMDYEQYFPVPKQKDTPALRDVFPPIPHQRHHYFDWYDEESDTESWFHEASVNKEFELTDWFVGKQKQLHIIAAIDKLRGEQ